jgi:hypothetical protein
MKHIIEILLLLVTACASTSIEQQWRAPQATQLHRVVTVTHSRDVTIRRTAEDDMAQQLRAGGVDAVPGYRILSDQDYHDREAAKAKLRAAGFDGVVVMRLASKDTSLQYVPGDFGAYGYWGAGWGAGGPGYYEPETIVRIETAAYSLQNNRLVYSALSKTIDPNSVSSMVSDVSKKIANAMQKQGVVVASPNQLAPAPAG